MKRKLLSLCIIFCIALCMILSIDMTMAPSAFADVPELTFDEIESSLFIAPDSTTGAAVRLTINNKSSDAGLTSVLSENITVLFGSGTAASQKVTSINVENSVSTVSSTDIIGAKDSTVTFYGKDSTFTNAKTESVPLVVGDNTNVYIKVTAEDEATVLYYQVRIMRASFAKYSNFLITKSSPENSDVETNYYYVYAGNSETSLLPFASNYADSVSNTAYSTAYGVMVDINNSSDSSAMLYFGATGNTLENASGALDITNYGIKLNSGTYTIKGAIKSTKNMGGNGVFDLQGASVIIDGATIDSTDYGIQNRGSGNVTVNSGTINSSSAGIDSISGSNVTINGGTIFGAKSAIQSGGEADIIVNGGTITSDDAVIWFSNDCTGDLTINGGEILAIGTSGGESINFSGSGNLTINNGKMSSLADVAVEYDAGGTLIVSGDLWDEATQTGTLLSSGADEYLSCALLVGRDTKSAEVKGGTLVGASTGVYAKSNVTISGGLIKAVSGNFPTLFNAGSIVTITGGTITGSNDNQIVDISDKDNLKFPGIIFLASTGTDTKLYINGGTVTNTEETGYAISNYCLSPGLDSYVYLSGKPSITGNTGTVYAYNNIYANDGKGKYYTGAPVTIYYSESITSGTTVAVSDVDVDTNANLFSLKNEDYFLRLSGTDLIIEKISSSSLLGILSQKITLGSEAGTVVEPKTASISVENSVSEVSESDITGAKDSTVIFYGTDNTFTTAETGSLPLTAGDITTVYIKITSQYGKTTSYYSVGINRAEKISNDSNLTTVLGKEISTEGVGGTVEAPITASISVENSVSEVSESDITGAKDSTVIFYGTDNTFTTAETGSLPLTAGDKTTVYIKVIAQDGQTVGYYAVGITRAVAISGNSNFLITKSSPEDSNTETSYYYVYAGSSEASLNSFAGSNADSVSNTAYSTVNRLMKDINASATSSAMLYFAATGNTLENASGALDITNYGIKLNSGTYTIKGAIKSTKNMSGNGLVDLQGASVIIDGATIDSTDHGIKNRGSGNVTVNSGTINASYAGIDSVSGSNVTINGGNIFGALSAIESGGEADIIVNGGTMTSDDAVIWFSNDCTGDLTINGGEILAIGTSGGESINFSGSGNLTINSGKMSSLADVAVEYDAGGTLIVSGDLWDEATQTGTLLSSGADEYLSCALLVGRDTKSAEVKGGTLVGASTGVYAKSNVTISGGLIKAVSGNFPTLFNEGSIVTITGGTITGSNDNQIVDISDKDNLKFPGIIFLASTGTDTKLYINGGTVTNTEETGYAISNYCLSPGLDSYVYLSGKPSITGNTGTVYAYNNIYANDGKGKYYTGAPVTIYYSESITSGTTVAVSDVDVDTNANLFSLKNEDYFLRLSGTDLIIEKISSSSLLGILSQKITLGSEAGTVVEPKTASISVENSVSEVSESDITGAKDSTVIFYGTDNTFTTAETGSLPLTAGDITTVYIKITSQYGKTTSYYSVEINRAEKISNDSNLTTVLGKEISTEGVGGTVEAPITASISVENSVSEVSESDITGAKDSTVIFYGKDSTFTTAKTGSVALTAGDKTTVYIKVIAQDGETVGYYAVGITRAVATGGSSDSSSSKTHSSRSSHLTNSSILLSSSSADIIVNGVKQSAGKEIKAIIDGKSKFTINVNEDVLSQKIAETIVKGADGTKQNIVEVVVSDADSDDAIVQLNGAIINEMEDKSFDLSVIKGNVSYSIPAKEFTIDAVAEHMGIRKDDLEDIEVEVTIGKPSYTAIATYEAAAKDMGNQLLIPPVSFTITEHVKSSDGKKRTTQIDTFSSYVERTISIPDGVDPSKITTGIVFNSDGTYSHVPTDVFQKDGKWYAKLNSLTNSDYSIIWNPVTVKSVENHWSKDVVNDMASRLVIFNTESFEPDKAITRSDFAEYIVRALGLYREGVAYDNNFKDVNNTGERTLGILIANNYGIVSGYEDGTFRGENQITREEAITMYQRAMKITKLTKRDTNMVSKYSDIEQVSKWAVENVTDVLSANVFNGTTETTISPKAKLTYSEAAQAIKNLLVESKLINK